ncbi:response regulator [Chloroflexota bacterium]
MALSNASTSTESRGKHPQKIRVVIADDHALVREGTRQILEKEGDIKVVGEAGDGEELVRLVTTLKPDVALVDIAMPVLDGIKATTQIKELYPETAVLILTAYHDDSFVFHLLEVGAAGYLLKTARGREVVEAVRSVNAGESVLHPAVARKVLNRFMPVGGRILEQKPSDVLTEREKEVLRLATRGCSNKEIGDELCLSVRTVQGHLRRIFNKLQVSSRTEAVVLALKQGWVILDDLP